MSAKPNYFKLGLFILISLFLLMTGIILFGSGLIGQKSSYFETYFTGSVSGLSVGAPIQDNGVQIGTVERISFIRNDYKLPEGPDGFSKYRPYVRVVCSVRSENLPEMSDEERQEGLDVLIKNGLRLRLSTNILTGQGFIEAEYVDPTRYPVESFPWKTEYPFIPSAPSTFTTLKDSVDKILHRLEQIDTKQIADNINDLLITAETAIAELKIGEVRSDVSRFLDNANKAVADAQVAQISDEIKKLFAEARETNQHLKELLGRSESQQDMSNVAELVDQINMTVSRIDRLIQTQSPQVIQLLDALKRITDTLDRLAQNLEENPSAIFSKPPVKKEPVQ